MAVAAVAMLATSCSKDDTNAVAGGEKSTVTFSVEAPVMVTRADLGDGTTATDLSWAVYAEDGTYLPNLGGSQENAFDAELKANVKIDLVNGKKYSVIFWAGAKEAPYTVDFATKTMTVNDPLAANQEKYDAFYKYQEVATVNGARTETIELTRPFAQLNIATADTQKAAYGGLVVKQTKVVVPAYKTLNLKDGSVANEVERVYNFADIFAGKKINGYDLLSMNYLLVNAKELETVKFTVKNEGFEQEYTYHNVPLQRNYKTNIIGNILTSTLDFEITIDPIFEEYEHGYVVTEEGGQTIATVSTPSGLAQLAKDINEEKLESNTNIVLDGDIDLSSLSLTRADVSSNWKPIGTEENPFTGTFDGNGHTIKNLNIVETEAKEGKAFIGFFGYAKDATIKNVVFENVNLNIPCLDIDHSQGHIGAVAGSLEGTSTIENVTVKGDIKVYATQNANGASRVAVVAGGNSYGNVTMKNVHVIANEGSYLKANNNTGALAGQLQGKSVFENCSSNIDVTVNKFFAGGIIGLAAGDQLFVNCHTTGDIAVVAGREGRAYDQYRVGGIAGGWADGAKNVCTLENCSYTGNVSGKNSDGSVANPLDYMGYVGRGYTLNNCQGSTVIIDGISFVQKYNTAAEAGIYDIYYKVSTAEEFDAAINNNAKGLTLANDVTLVEDATYEFKAGQDFIIDLGGYTLTGLNTRTATHNFLFDVKGGNLTVENGTIEYNHTSSNMGWNGATTIIDVTAGGVLNLQDVNLINAGGTDMNFAVHMNNWGEVTVNADNCLFDATYCGFRVFNSGFDKNNVVISNSTFNGATRAFWVHNYIGDLDSQHSNDAIKARLNFDIFGKGNTFTATSEVVSPVRYGFSKAVYINAETGEEIILASTSAELNEALVSGGEVVLGDDIAVASNEVGSNGYGATGISQTNGGVIDGRGHDISVAAWGTWDSAINTTGGTIKNINVTGGMRGIFVNHNSTYSDKVILENVTIDGTIYTISCDQGTNKGLEAYNSTFKGWTSYATTIGDVKFDGCSFGAGQGYAFCRPYAPTTFVNCDFEEGFELDAQAAVKFENCRLNGVVLTNANIATLVTYNVANVVEVK